MKNRILNADGSIDLAATWRKEHEGEREFLKAEVSSVALSFLALVCAYESINSTQVAALALAQADYYAMLRMKGLI